MTGREGFDFLTLFYPDARRDYTPAQRVWVIACWDALTIPDEEKAAWFLLPSGQGEPNNLDMIMWGDGEAVLEAAKAGEWL